MTEIFDGMVTTMESCIEETKVKFGIESSEEFQKALDEPLEKNKDLMDHFQKIYVDRNAAAKKTIHEKHGLTNTELTNAIGAFQTQADFVAKLTVLIEKQKKDLADLGINFNMK